MGSLSHFTKNKVIIIIGDLLVFIGITITGCHLLD